MFELLLKIVSFLSLAGGIAKLLYDFYTASVNQMREDYRFGREFLADIDARRPMHPFLREKGFHALAGSSRLDAEEVAYLIALPQAGRAIRDYTLGQPYLEITGSGKARRIGFRPRYRQPWAQRLRLWGYTVLYLLLFGLALSPLQRAATGQGSGETVVALAVSLVAFLPTALMALKAAINLHRARTLVRSLSAGQATGDASGGRHQALVSR